MHLRNAFAIVLTGLCATLTGAGVLGTAAPVRPHAESVAKTSSPRSLYVLHCAGCHGMDGSGSEQGQVPDMRRLGRFLQRPEGRKFLVQVPGVMGSGLNDKDVAQVTNWVLTTLATDIAPQTFVPYTSPEIAAARANPLSDVMATRARLLATEPNPADPD
jgi:mono/diheme cytochrome c family protein